MAKITTHKPGRPAEIKRFLGINENSDGQFGLKLGEAISMDNFRITQNYQLKKREGTRQVFITTGNPVRGMWQGELNNGEFFLFAQGGRLYSGNLEDGTTTELGEIEDAPTRFTAFGTKVYIQNGVSFRSFDGVTYEVVAGYRPKVRINAMYNDAGTEYELLNLLTGAKHMTFTTDGVAGHNVYQLPETNIDSVDFVILNGTQLEAGTEYTVNLAAGNITSIATWAAGEGVLDVGWTKGTGQRDIVEKNRFCMLYNGQNSNRAHMWGNPDAQNRAIWSGLANGVPSMEYWEPTAYRDVCSAQHAVTDIVNQYDAQRIFTDGAGAYYSEYSTLTLDNGLVKADFPTRELNQNVGNVAPGQTQVVNNSPITLFHGVRSWDGTTVRNQINEKIISEKVNDSLRPMDLTQAVTVNWQENYEYWICIGSIVWVWNYLNKTWYKFSNIPASCFLVVDGTLYFGSTSGIFKFYPDAMTDAGQKISARWEMGFYDFEAVWLTKYMVNIWITIKPDSKVYLQVTPVTNNEGNGQTESTGLSMNYATFVHADFAHWSFLTSYNPMPNYIEVQAMGFVYLKLILTSDSETENVTVLSIDMPVRYGGKVR